MEQAVQISFSPLENRLRSAFFLAASAVVLFCIVLVAITFGRPYMGTDLVLIDGTWRATGIDRNGLTGLILIQEGDIPLAINGQPAELFLEKFQDEGYVYGAMLKQLTMVNKDGEMLYADVNEHFPYRSSIFLQSCMLVVSLAFWIMGFFVFYKRPRNRAAFLFCICSLLIGFTLSCTLAGETGFDIGAPLSVVGTIIGPWVLLHFFIALPEARGWRDSRWVYLIYLPPLITLILFPLIGYSDGQALQGFKTFRLLELGAGFLLSLAVAVYNMIRVRSLQHRQQMQIVMTGLVAALIPFLALYLLPQITHNHNIIPPGFSTLFLVIIPVSLGYALVTHRLMDIDLVIRRGVVYALISLVMAAVLSAAIFSATSLRDSFDIVGEVMISVILGIVATALFGPAKKGIESLVDKLLYKDRYDYAQTVHTFSKEVSSKKDFNDIARLLVGTVATKLNLAGTMLLLRSQAGFYEVVTAQGVYSSTDKQMQVQIMIGKNPKLVEIPTFPSDDNRDPAFLIPMEALNRQFGILCVSEKANRQSFSKNDILLLQGLASVGAVGLYNTLLSHDVSLRDTFVSIASHELRTPLTSILGYAELLLKKDLNSDTRDLWLRKIISHGNRISDMVDDLLNVSRIQSGKMVLKMEPYDLPEILDERINVIKEDTSKHRFVQEIIADLPRGLVDRDKYGQVIGNLLSNAVKFSPQGGSIILKASYDAVRDRVIVSVTDEGIGIDAQDRDLLFTTFHRIKRPETTRIRGSGLGLYIVKEWTLAMGGEVWLESELNKGSTFFVAVQAVHENGAGQLKTLSPG